MKIKPTGNRVLAELIQDNPVSTGGIALPTNYIPVGPRKIRILEATEDSPYKKGDIALMSQHSMGWEEVFCFDKKCVLVCENNIIAVIEE